jgi:peptidoglycan/xylan/chitin deacetylase (PgdA/CDA1 family)
MSRAVVLVYHRVGSYAADPWALTVSPEHFEEHLRVIGELGITSAVGDLVDLQEAAASKPHICITFDDGYQSNMSCAKPILDRYDTPATFFLPTSLIGSRFEFWWDLLSRVVLETESLPEHIALSIGEEVYRTRLEGGPEGVSWWKAWEPPTGPRQNAYAEIWKRVHPLDARRQQEVMEELLAWAGLSPEPRADYSVMSWDDVAGLRTHPRIRIGSHSKDHVSLGTLSLEQQQEQLSASRERLEEAAHYRVDTLAYPFGTKRDYNADTLMAAASVGYRVACTTERGVVTRATDPLQLPRFHVTDWDAGEFRRRMLQWVEG